MQERIYFNSRHWNHIRNLVEEGVELRKIIDFYNQFPLTLDQLPMRSCFVERYQEIAQELQALPEELARRWIGAKTKLIENKVYPYNK